MAITPYEIGLNDKPFWIVDKISTRLDYLRDHPERAPQDLGLVAIGAFREKSYVDYVAIARVDDVGEVETWIRVHEQYEFLDWMAGVVYNNPDRAKQLRDTERSLGKFIIQFGFAPDYLLETAPSDYEMESYIQHIVSKDEVDGQLRFKEDDGA